MKRRAGWVLILCGVSTWAGCKHSSGLPSAVRERLANGASRYGEAPPLSVDDEHAQVVKLLLDSVPEAARSRVRHDPGLDHVAAVAAELRMNDRPFPSAAQLRWMYWRFGVTSQHLEQHWALWWGSYYKKRAELDPKVVQAGKSLASDSRPVSFGVARHESMGNTVQVIVTAHREATLDPVDKKVRAGATVRLSGRLEENPAGAKWFAPVDLLRSEERDLSTADGRFEIEFRAPVHPGRYFVEIAVPDGSAEAGQRWFHSALLVPFYVEVEEPASPDEEILYGGSRPVPASWGERVLYLYNRRRVEAGQPPLTLHPEASALAVEQARLHRAAPPGHPPPLVPDLASRFGKEGNPLRQTYQSFSTATSPEEFAWETLVTPRVRQLLFRPTTSLVGIGVVDRGEDRFVGVQYLGATETASDATRP